MCWISLLRINLRRTNPDDVYNKEISLESLNVALKHWAASTIETLICIGWGPEKFDLWWGMNSMEDESPWCNLRGLRSRRGWRQYLLNSMISLRDEYDSGYTYMTRRYTFVCELAISPEGWIWGGWIPVMQKRVDTQDSQCCSGALSCIGQDHGTFFLSRLTVQSMNASMLLICGVKF